MGELTARMLNGNCINDLDIKKACVALQYLLPLLFSQNECVAVETYLASADPESKSHKQMKIKIS